MLDRQIARYVVSAQISSDGGKHRWNWDPDEDPWKDMRSILSEREHYHDYFKMNAWDKGRCMYIGSGDRDTIFSNGYRDKSSLIRRAILRINKLGPKCGFRYYCVKAHDTGYLVYFSFKVNGERYQISFHDFSKFIANQANKPKSKKHEMHWETGRASSRGAAIVLDEYLLDEANR